MLEWWKDLIRPIRLSDPHFGQLRFLRDARFWEGRTRFGPVAREVEVIIHGAPSGPTNQQRSFFAEIERRYADIWPKIEGKLHEEATRISLDQPAFQLAAIEIPNLPSLLTAWQLAYETAPPSWHFTVTMQGWEPEAVLAEC